ncbi:MAG: sugar ABC transporter permease, partial [Candidatus Sumerlaeia bacterium]|nr:sugar ABC transporter permease [Candidatus Sumerlaeia bacterium]
KDLIEAARIDGANVWQNFWNVTVPSIWPIISLTAILSSIAALQVFEEIYMLTDGRFNTKTLVFEIYEKGFRPGGGIDMGYACAMGVVLFAMLFCFTALSVRVMERAYKS